MQCEVCIVGAGAAGLMAAVFAGRAGANVVVVERNTTAGNKLLRTGRQRCNLTHEATIEEFVRACEPFGRFLKHSFYTFSPQATRKFFHQHGLKTKVEPSGCVFPVSDRATDVKRVLLEQARDAGVRFMYGRRVCHRIWRQDGRFVVKAGDDSIAAERVIIATGGMSWPATGSMGDGYAMAAFFGHQLVEPRPILVPLITREKWCGTLQCTQRECNKGRDSGNENSVSDGAIHARQHQQPAVFDLSRQLAGRFEHCSPIEVRIDLFEGSADNLEQKVIRLCNEHQEERAGHAQRLSLRQLAEQLCRMARPLRHDAATAREKREQLLELLKALPLEITGTRPIKEATATRGGVGRDEIDPTTMQSKLCPGLFFAGEVIDVDGPCGGYNLQIAWSTGALAGKSAASSQLSAKGG